MKVELLAPAGSFEAFEAALSAGADAVYVGGSRFGARAYAENLDQEQLCRAIDRVHLLGKKLYMTVNTLLKDRELEELYEYMLPFYREGLDGVIVQDFGVLAELREQFPELPLHASTQMTVTGPEGAELLRRYGVKRIVPARELSLKEIRAIYDRTGMEIECFVHGALCYCYSGQCLMSSLIGGRSGNRGRCAQPCRLPWEVFEDGKRLNSGKTAYPLNMKDMCTVELLPEIIRAGVSSLKIEGRMKRPEYTAGVVGVYRKYLDLLAENPAGYRVEREDLEFLHGLFNRDGFNQSYYRQRNGRAMVALCNNRETARQTGTEQIYLQVRDRWISRKVQTAVSGKAFLAAGKPAVLEVSGGGVTAAEERIGVERADSRPVDRERVRRQLEKTGNSLFCFGKLDIEMEEGLFVPVQLLNSLRRGALEKLEEKILRRFRREAPDTPEEMSDYSGKSLSGAGLPEDRLHIGEEAVAPPELWASVETEEQLAALERVNGVTGIYLPAEPFLKKNLPERDLEELRRKIQRLQSGGRKIRLALPYVTRTGEVPACERLLDGLADAGLDGVLVRNLESAALLLRRGQGELAVLDAGVYTFQNEAEGFWREAGIRRNTVPLELNGKEIARRDNHSSEMIVYGRAPMMISAQCLKKNLDRCSRSFAALTLRDRKGAQFPVACRCNSCYNIIYNSLPSCLLDEARAVKRTGCRLFRMNFTVENGRETEQAARQFAAVWISGEKPPAEEKRVRGTRGHYRRGVE